MHACIEKDQFIKNPTEISSAPAFFIISVGVFVQTSMNKMFAKTKFKILNAF